MHHFKTNTYPMQISRTSCDAEIGSVKNGWHTCNKKAAVSDVRGLYVMHFCQNHANRAKKPEALSA